MSDDPTYRPGFSAPRPMVDRELFDELQKSVAKMRPLIVLLDNEKRAALARATVAESEAERLRAILGESIRFPDEVTKALLRVGRLEAGLRACRSAYSSDFHSDIPRIVDDALEERR